MIDMTKGPSRKRLCGGTRSDLPSMVRSGYRKCLYLISDIVTGRIKSGDSLV